jgi:hypothetical protein
MSVAEGTLTPAFRAEVVEFYSDLFQWAEIESLRLPDRMTLAVGGRAYINIRERPAPMVCSGYEHLGVLLDSPEAVEETWSMLASDARDVGLEELQRGENGYRGFRFRHLLPLAIEVQFLA